ncbi:hypothetical protein EIP86_005523 [Pleurotus ostreatoroseus]|nr:hypothetical protein EIP86_005523 [Pleurotus ostreatoroseus]
MDGYWRRTSFGGLPKQDIKPHNFVLTSDSRLQLIDFGSAAPLLTAADDGSQLVSKRYCLVPCGTCDYISPEILKSHEEALVALDMSDDPDLNPSHSDYDAGGYGRETDWWSFGAMLYEMAYGVAPFFANDVRGTYSKIMDHAYSLDFKRVTHVSSTLEDLLRRLLTTSELRLGRQSATEVMDHSFFDGISWESLSTRPPPEDIHLPQFVYSTPIASQAPPADASSLSEKSSHPFSFSAFFQSSTMSAEDIDPELAPVPSLPPSAQKEKAGRSILREPASAAFIGFSWGPARDAFPASVHGSKGRNIPPSAATPAVLMTPRPLQQSTPMPTRIQSRTLSTPQQQSRTLPFTPTSAFPFTTPVRQTSTGVDHLNISPGGATPFRTPYRPPGSTVPRRTVSDREAMKQLVDCVGMSARKRVLESGRKPRVTLSYPDPRVQQPPSTLRSRSSVGTGTTGTTGTLKALRFDRSVVVVADGGVEYRVDAGSTSASAASESVAGSVLGASASGPSASGSNSHLVSFASGGGSASSMSLGGGGSGLLGLAELGGRMADEFGRGWEEGSSTATEMSYSPTPRPRPGSVGRSRSGSGGSWSLGGGSITSGRSMSRTPSTSSVGSVLVRVNAGAGADTKATDGGVARAQDGSRKYKERVGEKENQTQGRSTPTQNERITRTSARARDDMADARSSTDLDNRTGSQQTDTRIYQQALRLPPRPALSTVEEVDDTNVFIDGTLSSSRPISLVDDVLERMERRHRQMMEEISAIGTQLDELSGRLNGQKM